MLHKLIPVLFMANFATGIFAAKPISLDESAFHFQLNDRGLNFIGDQFEEDLEKIDHGPIGDYSTKVSYGIRVNASGMHYKADLSNVQIQAKDQRLQISLDVENLVFHIDKISAKKKIIFKDISASCRDTKIHIAEGQPLTVVGYLTGTVEDGRVRVQVENPQFQIPDSAYRIEGPRSCSGKIGIDRFIKSAVRKALGKAKEPIEDKFREGLISLGPVLSTELTAMLSQELKISAFDSPYISSREGVVQIKPMAIGITQDQLELLLSGGVEKISSTFSNSNINNDSEHLGFLGIHPGIFGEILDKLVVVNGGMIPLNPLLGGSDLFSLDHFKKMYPELSWAEIPEVEMGLAALPQLEIEEGLLAVRNLGLKFNFNLPNGELATVVANLDCWLNLVLDQQNLTADFQKLTLNKLYVTGGPSVNEVAIGHWTNGVTSQVLSILKFFQFELPSYRFKGQTLKITSMSLDGELIKLLFQPVNTPSA